MSYNQVIVVEGKHDEQKIKSIFPGVECITTNGSSISEETINLIYETSLKKEVILFLDPDFPGKKITNKILEKNGSFKIAFINKENAISKNKKKVGIEHASVEVIKKSLENLFTVNKSTNMITSKDLMERRLKKH
jgi:ribonuclease M5